MLEERKAQLQFFGRVKGIIVILTRTKHIVSNFLKPLALFSNLSESHL